MPNKIVFDDFAVGAREHAYCGSNTTQQLVNGEDLYGKMTVGDATKDSVFQITTPYHCAGLDNGGIDLAQSIHVYETGDAVGFVSDTISDENCVFDTPPVLEILFSGNEYYSGNGITLYFNTHFCKRVKVQYYRDAAEISPESGDPYYDVFSLTAFLPRTVDTFNRIVITFEASEQPFQRAMVSMVTFGTTREITKIHSLQYHKKLYFDCSDIAIGTLDTVFESDEELNFFRNQKLLVYHSTGADSTYTLLGTYWVSESEKQTDVLYAVTGEDSFGVLDNVTVSSILGSGYSGYNFSDFIDEAEQKSGLDFFCTDYDLAYILRGYEPQKSIRERLATMMFALQRYVIVQPNGDLSIDSISESLSKTIEAASVLGDSSFSKSEKVTGVRCLFTIYPTGGDFEGSYAYTGDITTAGIVLTADYPIYSHSIMQNGQLVIDGYTYEQIDASTIKISAESATLSNVNVFLRRYNSYKYQFDDTQQSSSSDVPIVKDYGSKPFVIDTYYSQSGSESFRDKMTGLCERLYANVGIVKAKYIGGDIDVGDYVSIETKYSGTLQGTVTEITGDVGYSDTIQDLVITIWQ